MSRPESALKVAIDEHQPIPGAARDARDWAQLLGVKASASVAAGLAARSEADRWRLRRHFAAAERRGGTLADAEIVVGRANEVTVVRREHDELAAHAADLVAVIEYGRDAANLSKEARLRAAQFAHAFRRHLLVEINLVQLRFILDVGVVD
jgi:hypothetical protein